MLTRFSRRQVVLSLAALCGFLVFLLVSPWVQQRWQQWIGYERGTWNGSLHCRPATFRPEGRPCRLVVRIDGVNWEVDETPQLRALHTKNPGIAIVVSGIRRHENWISLNEIFLTEFHLASGT